MSLANKLKYLYSTKEIIISAIKTKGGTSPGTFRECGDAILKLPTSTKVTSIDIIANGNYNASNYNVDGFNIVNVNVPGGATSAQFVPISSKEAISSFEELSYWFSVNF